MKNRVLILDVETATLPLTKEIAKTPKEIKLLNIARPLIYDIGWVILNTSTKKIESKKNFLVEETFFIPLIFNTAYYKEKRPIYLDLLKKKEIIRSKWDDIINILEKDLLEVDYSIAYNAMFDFKKAIPFTEEYFSVIETELYQEWEDKQKNICKSILNKRKKKSVNDKDFDSFNFSLKGKKYPIKDLWGLSCEFLINKNKYKEFCISKGLISNSGLFFKTSAESVYRFLEHKYNFIESHTALNDAEIETEIFIKCLEFNNLTDGITYFPFRILGETVEFIKENGIKDKKSIENIKKVMYSKLNEYDYTSPFSSLLESRILELEKISPSSKSCNEYLRLEKQILIKEIENIYNRVNSLNPNSNSYYNYVMQSKDKIDRLNEIDIQLKKEEQKKKKVYIYYHNYDFDGKFSGSIVDYYFNKEYQRIWIGYNYEKVLDFSQINKKDFVFIVDLALEGDTLKNLEKLTKKNKNIIWCDHHPSSVNYKGRIKGYRSSIMSGCALTYLYLMNLKLTKIAFDNLVPKEIQLISDADTFTYEFIETGNFCSGLLGEETNPEYLNNVWKRILNKEVTYKSFLTQGSFINKYRYRQSEDVCSLYGYEVDFEGIKTFCVNSHRINLSTVKDKYDLCIFWFYMGNNQYKYSLRSNGNVNCRIIAEKYGGGGHDNAASFITNEQLKINIKERSDLK